MAKCDEGYNCEVCGEDVPNITVSDLYLRFVIGEIPARELLSAMERHLHCNPTLAQYIVHEKFASVTVEGPFSKTELDPQDVQQREELVTAGWLRLQEIPKLGLAINEYPLERVRKK